MTKLTEQIIAAFSEKANQEKEVFFLSFFKAMPGGYGEGDQFLRVIVPEQRKVALAVFKEIDYHEIDVLLKNSFHEVRLTALYI